jgi:hypothetical protein
VIVADGDIVVSGSDCMQRKRAACVSAQAHIRSEDPYRRLDDDIGNTRVRKRPLAEPLAEMVERGPAAHGIGSIVFGDRRWSSLCRGGFGRNRRMRPR